MLTLGKSKELLSRFAPESRLEWAVNRAVERLLLETRIVRRLALLAPYGKVALPPAYRTVEGVKLNGQVRELANIYYEWLPGKFDAQDYSATELRDLGDQAIMNDLPAGGTLAVAGTTTEIVEVTGEDAYGLTQVLTLTGPTPVANSLVSVLSVTKEQGVAAVLSHTAADATVTMLAVLDKLDEFSVYRRYFIGSLVSTAANVVTALARLRHREFRSDDDILPIDNLGALEAAMTAIQMEGENDPSLANQHFARAIRILEKEESAQSGRSELPSLRMVFVGGAPKLKSFY